MKIVFQLIGLVAARETQQRLAHTNNGRKIFPNPANDILNIEYKFDSDSKKTIEIYNPMGIKVKTFLLTDENESAVVPVNDLSAGLYVVRLIDDGHVCLSTKIGLIR